ncbi:hypothetical protein LXL04_025015 [Taraxacum kok-saghyz]
MANKNGVLPTKELLKKIHDLEQSHAHLNHNTSATSGADDATDDDGGVSGPSAVKLTETQYLNILQSMGQSVHIFDLNGHIIYWNRMAENLYGYSTSEALGETAYELLVDSNDYTLAEAILQRTAKRENWSG